MQVEPNELDAVVKRLRRAQGQLGGIIQMIEDGRECREVITQVAAVSKAVDRAGFAIIATSLRHCLASGEEHDELEVADLEKLFLSLA